MIPNALEKVEGWRRQRRESGHLLLALDFDGTIAPIVSRPQDAQMVGAARGVIERLLKRPDTDVAIVSGRALADIRERCRLDGLYYAGNHGLQIEGPGVHETRSEALQLLPRVRAMASALERELADIPGVYFEDKELTLSIHSRLIDDETERSRVHNLVERQYASNPAGLRLTYGRRVIEVRPSIDWHKGRATLFLIDCIKQARGSELFPIFIGDDETDEDAFSALRANGAGVLVAAEPPAHTAATAYVRDVTEVVALLEAFAA